MRTLGIFRTKIESFSWVLFTIPDPLVSSPFRRCVVSSKSAFGSWSRPCKSTKTTAVCCTHHAYVVPPFALPPQYMPFHSSFYFSPFPTGTGVHELSLCISRLHALFLVMSVVLLPCLSLKIPRASPPRPTSRCASLYFHDASIPSCPLVGMRTVRRACFWFVSVVFHKLAAHVRYSQFLIFICRIRAHYSYFPVYFFPLFFLVALHNHVA